MARLEEFCVFRAAIQLLKERKMENLIEQTYEACKAELAKPKEEQVNPVRAIYERIMVPITDGKRVYNIPCNLKEAYRTEGRDVVKQFERVIMLHIIDDCWKENLRQLDELRHSVQNASYEQKDPLLIFKLESAKLFDSMVNDMNNRIASILTRGQIPEMQQQQEVREAAPEERTQRQQYTEQKAEINDPAQQAAANHDTRENIEENHTPLVKDKLPGRNDPCPCGSGKKFKNCHGKGLE